MMNINILKRRNHLSRNQQGYVHRVIYCVLASSVIGKDKSPDLCLQWAIMMYVRVFPRISSTQRRLFWRSYYLVPLGAKLINCLSIQTSFSTIWAHIYRRKTTGIAMPLPGNINSSLQIKSWKYKTYCNRCSAATLFFLQVEKAKGKNNIHLSFF